MKVLLQKNVPHLGAIGEVVDVKPGYARNYLIPHGLAAEPTRTNLRAVEVAKQKYLEELAKIRTEWEAKAKVVQGRQLAMQARANEEGHLYGSIGPAQIVAALAAQNVFIEADHVAIDEPIRQIGTHEVTLRFAEGITATISVSVAPVSGEGHDSEAALGPAGHGQTESDREGQ